MCIVFHWIFRQPSLFEIFYWSLSTFSPGVQLNPTLQQTFLRSQKERKRTFCKCHSYLALPSGYTLAIKSNHMIWPTSLQFLSFLRYLILFQIPLLRQDAPYPAIYWVFLNISPPSVHGMAERAGCPSQLSLTSSHPHPSLYPPPAVPVPGLPWLLQPTQGYELFGQHFLGKQVVGWPGAPHELQPFLGHQLDCSAPHEKKPNQTTFLWLWLPTFGASWTCVKCSTSAPSSWTKPTRNPENGLGVYRILLWGGNGQPNMKDIHSSSVKKHLSNPEAPWRSGWSHSSCQDVIRSIKILVNLYLERWNVREK